MKIKIKSNQLEAIEGMKPEYPYVMHHVNLEETTVPWHWHAEVEFGYIVSGKAEVSTAYKKYVFNKNEGFFINTNILCSMNAAYESDHIVLDSHLFDPVFLGGHFKSIFQTKYIEPILQNKRIEIVEFRGENERQRKILKKLQQVSFLRHERNHEFQTRNLFSDIWLLLLEEIKETRMQEQNIGIEIKDRIQTMMSFIQNSYMEKITLEDIAKEALVSRRECIRCFETSIGKTPIEYLIEYRIGKAEKMLKNSDDSISNIAMQTGFLNSAYFAKVFKNKRGITPREYRGLTKKG